MSGNGVLDVSFSQVPDFAGIVLAAGNWKENTKVEKEENRKIYFRNLTYVITVGWPVYTRNALKKWEKNIKHSPVKQQKWGGKKYTEMLTRIF